MLFGVVHSYPSALVARGVLGMGDAMTFVSVLRVVAGTFPVRGYPYLVQEYLSAVRADEALGGLVIGGLVANPVLGVLTSRHRVLRMPLVAGYLVVAAAAWVPLPVVPGRLPFLVLLVAFVVFAVGGPMSAVGFALARDYNPIRRVGTATGVDNVGGFLATTMAALGVGVLVQVSGSYRLGLSAVFLVMALGMSRVAVWWRRTRAEVYAAQHRGEDVPVRVTSRRWDVRPDLVAA